MNSFGRLLRSMCVPCAILASYLMVIAQESFADYTRVNYLSNVKLADVATNCDFRLRLLAGTSSNNSYKVGYVSQNSAQGYILEALLTSSQVQELLKLPAFFSGRTPSITGTPTPGSTHSLRVLVPLSGVATSVVLVTGGQSIGVIPSVLELEKQCATTSAVSVQAGGSDGCAMLAFKQSDGSCACGVTPLSDSNPCADLSTQRCVRGAWDPRPGQTASSKCVGPLTLAPRSYFFNSSTCACELCDETAAIRSGDGSACTCKFSKMSEVMVIPPQQVYRGSQLEAIKNKCNELIMSGSGMGGRYTYFDKGTCSCSFCPSGQVANPDGTGCVRM